MTVAESEPQTQIVEFRELMRRVAKLMIDQGDALIHGRNGRVRNESSKAPSKSPIDRLRVLVTEAKKGVVDVVPEIRKILDQHPEIWRRLGDLSSCVESRWIGLVAGDDVSLHESLSRRVTELREEILGEDGGIPLERLLAERIVIAWLQVRFFDAALSLAVDGGPASHIRMLNQQLGRAQRRYATAIKSMAEVRTLLP